MSVRDELVQVLSGLTEEQLTAAAPLIEAVAEAAKTNNLDEVDLDEFRESLNLKRLLNPIITELEGVVLPEKAKPLADRIKDGGYNYANSDITADRFPITLDAGPRDLVLAHFGVNVQSDEVNEWAEANGYELALHEDLEAVGSHPKHKDLQREFPIIQLGSSAVIDGNRVVPYLSRDGAERRLSLSWYGGDWYGSCRFLLVRKSQPLDTRSLGA